MKINKKFMKRLDRLVDKYGKRKTPLEEEEDYFLDEVDDDFREMMRTYRFHYEVTEKKKDVLYMFDYDIDDDESDKIVNLLFFDEELTENLKKLTEFSGLFSNSPEVDVSYLYNSINDLRIKYNGEFNNPETKLILDFVEELYSESYSRMDKMISENKIDYNSLWYYYDKVGTVYSVKFYNNRVCFKQSHFEYIKGEENKLVLYGKILFLDKGELKEGYHAFAIDKFVGTRDIDSFDIKRYDDLTEDERAEYISYGKTAIDMGDKINYMYLKGNQYILSKQIVTFLRDNRVIVDTQGLEKFDNKPFDFEILRKYDIDKDADYALVFPLVGVFSMGTNKCWGMAHVKDLKPIEYQSDAFDYLVLEEHKKNILKGLIRCHRKDLEDFIEGKGQGLIFLLNGPPGVGKTLTAEATSEYLKKPLYNVNVGDLGTNPEVMEGIMERIIEYSERWEAIILIDEADIFLEEREFSNILRNALVSTFLKFLEFNRGIMFLTTNRLNSIDEAVKSRVNMFLSYKKLTYEYKCDIWRSILRKWKFNVSDATVQEVAELELNGREIRNYMRLVVSIMDDRDLEFTEDNLKDILQECYELTNEFNTNVAGHLYT